MISTNVLEEQSTEYQKHLTKLTRINTVLRFQHNIRNYKTIPKQYLPPSFPDIPGDDKSKLTSDFQTKYNNIFFAHLDEVIAYNTITQELEQTRLKHIILYTEHHLAKLPVHPTTVANLYHQFLERNNIANHQTLPELQCILSTITTPNPNNPAHSPTPPTTKPKAPPPKRKRALHYRSQPSKRAKLSCLTSATIRPSSSTEDATLVTTTAAPSAVRNRARLKQQSDMTIHNFSTYELTEEDIQLLNKGLTFAPTPDTPTQDLHVQILRNFNDFAQSLRLKYTRSRYTKRTLQPRQTALSPTTTQLIYRPMRFLPLHKPQTDVTRYSGFATLERYIDDTKQRIVDNLSQVCHNEAHNLSNQQQRSIHKLQRSRHLVTIKPADKNLGIVLLNTSDYITQCMTHLTDSNTYRQTTEFPTEQIRKQLTHTLSNFKQQLDSYDKRLYKYLYDPPAHSRPPLFYGIPKVHKQFTHLPPLRPIVSQTNSLLSPTAIFIDHVLQPLAQHYPDYCHNSATLSLRLEDLHVPDEATLVAVDVVSLYPSIPQSQCLQAIYDELHAHKHLLTFDPNLIIRLLHTNINNNNYFTFNNVTFQQVNGTAMGAPFSPTIANIFMSTTLRDFLQTQDTQPLFLTRYIDDIFIIWTDTTDKLTSFLNNLNSFHPNLNFTNQQSPHSIDFLDLTIYKGPTFHFTNILDTKTYQKQLNLYQYLHYTSNHPTKVFKAILKGECIRYVRTNTTYETYIVTVHNFRERLRRRNYPNNLINKLTAIVKYSDRKHYLQQKQPQQTRTPPLYKYTPPPQYRLLKQLVLHDYNSLHFTSPRFIALRHPTLHNKLVRSRIDLTDDQLVDVCLFLDSTSPSAHSERARLPTLRFSHTAITPCNHPRCKTCRHHLNTSPTFKSNYPHNRTIYRIRHSFSCKSPNAVYLITCTKCKKQYVGCTDTPLHERMNKHRTSINTKQQSYIYKHFNLPDHSILHLRLQPIDTPTNPQDLYKLEKYWIHTLRTLTPYGLNSSPGNT